MNRERGRNSVINALDFVKNDLSPYYLRRKTRITAQQLTRVYEKYKVKHPDSFFDYEDISYACLVLDCLRLGTALRDPILEILAERYTTEPEPTYFPTYVCKVYV